MVHALTNADAMQRLFWLHAPVSKGHYTTIALGSSFVNSEENIYYNSDISATPCASK